MKRILIIIYFLVFYSVSAYAGGLILNIWDGTEYAVIEQAYNNEKVPNLQSIGTLKHLTCNTDFGMITQTRPQHATMLTGYLADVHGIYSNKDEILIPKEITIYYDLISQNPLIRTAFLTGKPTVIGEAFFGDLIGFIDVFWAEDRMPFIVTNVAVNLLSQWQNKDVFMVVHFKEPDEIGHEYGVNSFEYKNQLARNDIQLGRLLEVLGDNNIIIVLGDHGFGCPDNTHHHCSPNTFIVSNVEIPDNLFEIDVVPLILQLINSY